MRYRLSGGGGRSVGSAGTLGLTGLETVLEAAGDGLEVTHASGTSGLSPHTLLGPVDCAERQTEVSLQELSLSLSGTYTCGS